LIAGLRASGEQFCGDYGAGPDVGNQKIVKSNCFLGHQSKSEKHQRQVEWLALSNMQFAIELLFTFEMAWEF
jgi:hypothetical protein